MKLLHSLALAAVVAIASAAQGKAKPRHNHTQFNKPVTTRPSVFLG